MNKKIIKIKLLLVRAFAKVAKKIIPMKVLRKIRHYRNDVYVISFPKCGRTWLRILISKALIEHYNLDVSKELYLNPHKLCLLNSSIPRIDFCHDDTPHWKLPEELSTDKSMYKKHKVIFLVRDPRDVIISFYFQKRERRNNYNDDINRFIYERNGGVETIVKYYNIWFKQREVPEDFLLLKYEDLVNNTQEELKKVLQFIGLVKIDDNAIKKAVEFSSFNNMRKLEEEDFFSDERLRARSKGDEGSFKTRKGKIGGYKDYLNEEEIKWINNMITSELDSNIGY